MLVATCNRTPEEFETSTVHREHPQARFAQRIRQRCAAAQLFSPGDAAGAPIDYRATLTVAKEPSYLCPLDESTNLALEGRFAHALAGTAPKETLAQTGPGRTLPVCGCEKVGVARTTFKELCDTPLGATDYIALAQQFHTLFVTDVPQLSLRSRDQARRFITLIDQLYNHKTLLVASVAVPLPHLFEGGGGGGAGGFVDSLEGLEFEGEAGKSAELNPIGVTAHSLSASAAATLGATGKVGADSRKRLASDSLFTGEDETFAFKRAISRLMEMQSEEYLRRSGAKRVATGL